MSQNIIRKLQLLKHGGVNPREEWVAKNRRLLLSQIQNSFISKEAQLTTTRLQEVWNVLSIFLPRNFVYNVLRPAGVLLVVLAVLASGAGAVDAAYETLPGDKLYIVKRVAEKTQVAAAAIIGDKTTEIKLHVEFSQRRGAELKKLARTAIASPDPVNAKRVHVAISDLKDEITTVQDKLEDSKNLPATAISAGVAKDVKQNSDQIKNVLQEVKNNLSVSQSVQDKQLSQEVTATNNLVKDAGLKAVEVMVVKHLEGDTSVSKEEVKQEINSTLQTVATDAVATKQTVDDARNDVKNAVESAKNEVKDLNAPTGNTPPTADNVAAAANLTSRITSVANQTVKAVLKTEVAAAEVDKKLTEAQQLLGNNDLISAVDKIKEAVNANKEVEKISDATVEQAKAVLPAMPVAPAIKSDTASTSPMLVPVSPVSPTTASTAVPSVLVPGGDIKK